MFYQVGQNNLFIIYSFFFSKGLIDVENDLTLNSYEWLSLIRYEIDQNSRTENKIHFVQFSNRIHYNFEFIGMNLFFI